MAKKDGNNSQADTQKSNSRRSRHNETLAQKKQRALAIISSLKLLFPKAECALRHDSAFQLLVATILSAQCTDERVNKTTPELFSRYPDARSLAAASQEEIEQIVRPLGFFRTKATSIRGMAQALTDHFDSEVPQELEQLVKLPGVGRKTASVVLGTWFGIPSGIVVDTHVRRLTNLLGLTKSGNPEIIERELMDLIPKAEWIEFSHRLIHHGRQTCVARRPKCQSCGLLEHCQRVGLQPLNGSCNDEAIGKGLPQ